MQNSYLYPMNYAPSFQELTQAKSIGVPVLFLSREISEKEKEAEKIRAKIKKLLRFMEDELMAYWRLDPKENSLFHKEGQLSKDKNDITIHINNESPVGVFREEKDLMMKLGNEIIKAPFFDELYHISTAK
ncbi:hypothetical protein [Adhaeribacter aquaticus]|uniref:hypothetical protein n=1 Tax=Adhaeribacter aquaticus TaxID=299567 RepID=UPI00047BF718|nr:hypothetical protein [Adhaeribacter aquaticus]